MRLTLCGSTRFGREFDMWNSYFTLCGLIVYSIGVRIHGPGKMEVTEGQKRTLDEVHLRKIAASDAVFVIDQGIDFVQLKVSWRSLSPGARLCPSYVGSSTSHEVSFARKLSKPVYMASEWDWGGLIEGCSGDPSLAFRTVFGSVLEAMDQFTLENPSRTKNSSDSK